MIYSWILFLAIIVGSSHQRKSPIDVLVKLQLKVPNCELRSFVQNDEQWELLKNDLSKYCSSSSQITIQSEILCRMIYSEVRRACKLPTINRPSPTKYNSKTNANKICSIENIQSTNQWIWKKLGTDYTNSTGFNTENLCQKLTNNTDLLQLIRFFYKIAPLVRQADLLNATQDISSSNSLKKTVTNITNETNHPEKAINETNKTNGGQSSDTSEIGSTKQSSSDSNLTSSENRTRETLNGTNTFNNKTTNSINATGQQTNVSSDNNLINSENKTVVGSQNGTELMKKLNETSSDLTKLTSVTSNNNSNGTISNSTIEFKTSKQPLDVSRNQSENSPKTSEVSKEKENNSDEKEDDQQDTNSKSTSIKSNETKSDPKHSETIGQIPKPTLELNSTNTKDSEKTSKSETKNKNSDQTSTPNTTVIVQSIDEVDDADDENKDSSEKSSVTKSVHSPVVDKNQDTNDDETDETKNQPERNENNRDDDENGGDNPQLDHDQENTEKVDELKKAPTYEQKESEKTQFSKPINKQELEPNKIHPKFSKRYPEDEGWSGNFVTYFLIFTLFVVVGYLILHNKNKVLGLLIEGCRRDRSPHGRRTGSSGLGRYQRVSQSS